MMNNPKPISEFLVPGKRAHLVGIGGVSMCPLAEVLAGKGLLVQGSDMMESDSVKHLRSKGISVAIGHNAENLGDERGHHRAHHHEHRRHHSPDPAHRRRPGR